jgi:hypothetical protein
VFIPFYQAKNSVKKCVEVCITFTRRLIICCFRDSYSGDCISSFHCTLSAIKDQINYWEGEMISARVGKTPVSVIANEDDSNMKLAAGSIIDQWILMDQNECQQEMKTVQSIVETYTIDIDHFTEWINLLLASLFDISVKILFSLHILCW